MSVVGSRRWPCDMLTPVSGFLGMLVSSLFSFSLTSSVPLNLTKEVHVTCGTFLKDSCPANWLGVSEMQPGLSQVRSPQPLLSTVEAKASVVAFLRFVVSLGLSWASLSLPLTDGLVLQSHASCMFSIHEVPLGYWLGSQIVLHRKVTYPETDTVLLYMPYCIFWKALLSWGTHLASTVGWCLPVKPYWSPQTA